MSSNQYQSKIVLDLTGLNCPLPILKTKQQLNNMQVGDIVTVIATDPHSEIDFKAYLARMNHKLLDFDIKDNVYTFCIKKM